MCCSAMLHFNKIYEKDYKNIRLMESPIVDTCQCEFTLHEFAQAVCFDRVTIVGVGQYLKYLKSLQNLTFLGDNEVVFPCLWGW